MTNSPGSRAVFILTISEDEMLDVDALGSDEEGGCRPLI